MRRFDIAWRPSLFELAFGPRTFDCDVSALDVAGLLQTIAERGHIKCIAAGRRAVKEPDHWHRRLLRTRRERPRSRSAAKCGQQFPPSDGDCHTPLPCEVRRGNDTTPRACGLHIQGGQDAGCFTSVVLHLPLMPNSNEGNAPIAIGYSG